MATLRIEYTLADRKLRTAEFGWGDGEVWAAEAKRFFAREHAANGWPMYLVGMDVDGENRRSDDGGMLPVVREFMEWWCNLGRDGVGGGGGTRRYFCDEHGSMWLSRDGGKTWDPIYAVNDCRCAPPGGQPATTAALGEEEMTVRAWLGPAR